MAGAENGPRYATADDVRAVLSRSWRAGAEADDDTAASLPTDRLEEAIRTAEGDIDSALAEVYPVPFESPAPALIKGITVALAAYLADLTDRQSEDTNAQDPVTARQAWARARLNALRRGEAGIPGLTRHDPAAADLPTAGEAINDYAGTMFPMSSLGLGPVEAGYAPWELGHLRDHR